MENEKRLIDANALKRFVCETCNELNGDEPCEPSDCRSMVLIDEMPTVDAVEVVHGRWEDYSQMPGYLQCSNCHDAHIWFAWLKDGKWNYCPNCGAKMDGGKKDGV